jgi:hypothetical protein
MRQADQSELHGIQSECSIKCLALKWNTEPRPGEVNVEQNKEHGTIVTCLSINHVNLLRVSSNPIYTYSTIADSENIAHVSSLTCHRKWEIWINVSEICTHILTC